MPKANPQLREIGKMSKKWSPWSLKELDILGEYWYDAPPEKLMRLLPGRSWQAIRGAGFRYGMHRKHIIRKRNGKAIAAERNSRKHQPFAGCRHSPEAKLRIRISNLYARNHSITDIAERVSIPEVEVQGIIKKRGDWKPKKKKEKQKNKT